MDTALRICPFCEATCGLTLTIDDGRVTAARGDHDDVFSAGFICPKGASFGELDNDPDRLTGPLVRRDGVLTEATWDEAYAVVAERLGAVIAAHGGASVGVYLGNPNAHTIAGALYAPLILKALGTRQVFSASTLDQMPKHVALGLMFGSPGAFAVPDLDRFKSINDTFGHTVGDEVLIAVGDILRRSCRGSATFARIGGEEFVIAYAGDSRIAPTIAEHIRKQLLDSRWCLTASFGIASAALLDVQNGDTEWFTEHLLRVADQLMYTAKRAGGDRIESIEFGGEYELRRAG